MCHTYIYIYINYIYYFLCIYIVIYTHTVANEFSKDHCERYGIIKEKYKHEKLKSVNSQPTKLHTII